MKGPAVVSTRAEDPKRFVRVDKAARRDVRVGVQESLVQCGPLRVVEPVPGIKREKDNFGTVRQIGGLIEQQSTRTDPGRDRHQKTLPLPPGSAKLT